MKYRKFDMNSQSKSEDIYTGRFNDLMDDEPKFEVLSYDFALRWPRGVVIMLSNSVPDVADSASLPACYLLPVTCCLCFICLLCWS